MDIQNLLIIKGANKTPTDFQWSYLVELTGLPLRELQSRVSTKSESGFTGIYFYFGSLDQLQLEERDVCVWFADKKENLGKSFSPCNIFTFNLEFPAAFYKKTLQYLLKASLVEQFNPQLDVWTKQFGELLEQNLSELQRIKKIHEKIVPVREYKLKGAHAFSKYSAGSLSGGDFFDVIEGQNEVTVLLSSTHSYLISSIVMSHAVSLRQKKSITSSEIEAFLTGLYNDLAKKSLKFEKGEESGLVVLKINLKEMSSTAYMFGHVELVSSGKIYKSGGGIPLSPPFFEQSKIDLKLSRGEKLIFLSPGVRRNLKGFIRGSEILGELRRLSTENDPSSFLNELFYELKRDIPDDDLLKYDASVLYFEVDQNAIFTV